MPLAGQRLQAYTSAYRAVELTDQTSITSTTPVNGSPLCGVTFVAPASGLVRVTAYGDIQTAAASGAGIVVGWRVRTGSTIGSGTIIDGGQAGDGDNGDVGRVVVQSPAAVAVRIGASVTSYVDGLVVGDTYNAHIYHFIFGTTGGLVIARSILVEPLL